MTQQNKKLFSRLIFLGFFGLTIFGIFWIGQVFSRFGKSADLPGEYQKGTAVLVEFSDFQCPACGMYYPVVRQLKDEFGDKLTVVYKHFPLRQIHKNADLAARASEAALLQSKFQEMHNMIFEKQKEWSDSDQAFSLFTAYAIELGLDKDRFLTDIDSDPVEDKVSSNYQEGVRLGVRGTPTFFLNGKKLTNPRNYNEFQLLIQNEIKQ